MPARAQHSRTEERHLQRAVLPRSLSRAAGDARSHDHRGAGAGLRDPVLRYRQRHSRSHHTVLFRRHRQGALSPSGGARGSAAAHRAAAALAARHLEVLHRGAGRGPGSGARRDDGGTGGRHMIDARAVVSSDAELAPDVTVGPYSIIGPQVKIGARTVIGPHVVINGPTRIGADNRIFQFASLGDAPQDKKYQGEPTLLTIGDRNVFRESCTMNRGTVHDKAVTRIGNDNLFMAYSHVAHDCVIGDNTVFANCASLGGHVEVGDWVIVGGLSAVHQFVKIGAHAFLGGGSILSRDVPPYVMVAGNPAVPHTVNSEGLRRRGFNEEQIRNIREAYRILYRSELKLADALARLDELAQDHAEVLPFVDFIRGSTRSLVR